MEPETADPAGRNPEQRPAAQLAVVRQGEKPQLYRLEAEPVLLGRSEEADLRLEDENIAPRHALLVPDASGWQVAPLGNHATYLDREPLPAEEMVPWAEDQTLRIGPYLLRWRPISSEEDVGAARPIRSTSVPDPLAPPRPAGLRPDGQDFGERIGIAVEPERVALTPGEQATIQITLSNRGNRAEDCTLDLSGLPREWVSTSREFVRLAPGGQASLSVVIHPPPNSDTKPGDYVYRLAVTSSSVPEEEGATAEGAVDILDLPAFTASLHPKRWRHGKPGRVVVKNRGNTSLRLIVGGHDPSGAVVFDRRRALAVAPGATESASLVAKSVEEPLLIREQVFPFTIHVQPDKLAARQITGELLRPSRLLFGCLLLLAIALLALLVLLGGVWLGLITARIPGLVANGDLQSLREQSMRLASTLIYV